MLTASRAVAAGTQISSFFIFWFVWEQALRLLWRWPSEFCCFATALLLLYYCFTTALLSLSHVDYCA
jgi:hypothetical protein